MASGLNITVRIAGDADGLARTQAALRDPKRLMRGIEVLGMSSAVRRLETVTKKTSKEENVRSGRLAASLVPGRGGADTFSELSDTRVEFGTNVPYAAQFQFGGDIKPIPPRKALAIPLIAQLARNRIGPLELDPGREDLDFVPISHGNVIGLLVDTENTFGFGEDEALYALAQWVTQEPHPFLMFDDEDQRVIRDDLIPAWLEGK